MALPKNIEIVEEPSGSYRGHKTSIPLTRDRECNSCDKMIERVKDSHGNWIIPSHNRKVFRRMIKGHPDWVLEICPGGKI